MNSIRTFILPKTHNPVAAFEWTAVFIRPPNAKVRELYLWFAEAKPSSDVVTNKWTPLRDWTVTVSHSQVWFWRGVWDIAGIEQFFEQVQGGIFPVKSFDVSLKLLKRPIVLIPAGESETPLVPFPAESTWIYEFWDSTKSVKELVGQTNNWVERVNTQVKKRLGLDLNYWADRVGNILVFIPTGIQVDWGFDQTSQSAVLRTNLGFEEVSGYEIELEAVDGQETSYRRRLAVKSPNIVFSDLELFRDVRITLWKENHLIFQSSWLPILKGISFDVGLYQGTRNGTLYTSNDVVDSGVGELTSPPWIRLTRERKVDLSREKLSKDLDFRFYEPGSREEARRDLVKLMERAKFSIRIWDPYFGRHDTSSTSFDDIDLFEKIKSLRVRIEVLTSCDKWTLTSASIHLLALEERLKKRLQEFPERYKNVIVKAWVRGNDTTFHDRFLIIDEKETWLLGSSINSLGSKHSTLMKVQYANQIVVAFDQIWHKPTDPHFHILEVFDGK